MKTICVVTTTRADFYLLLPVIKRIETDMSIKLALAVTGSHLSAQYGMTIKEIETQGIPVHAKIPIIEETHLEDMSFITSLATARFGEYFQRTKPDTVVLLGDRHEILGIASAAVLNNIPICHMHGGETTFGAVDEYIRHAVTKLSYLHFTSCEQYRKRIIQMGEDPERVFNTGAVGVENIKNTKLLTKTEMESFLGIKLDKPFFLITYHAETLINLPPKTQIDMLLKALSDFNDCIMIFTKANADIGGLIINEAIETFCGAHTENARVYHSLGGLKYLSLMKFAAAVIGNSSSGIIETPTFGIPTVNIGDRQKGRVQADSIINTTIDQEAIKASIAKALTKDFLTSCKYTKNPYEKTRSSEKIFETIKSFVLSEKTPLQKYFYDIDFEGEK